MNIIQTLNCFNDEIEMQRNLEYMHSINIKTIRMNLCKYSFEESEGLLKYILKILKNYSDNFEFILDVPYPKNKARIQSITIDEPLIIKGKTYIVTQDKNLPEYKKNVILMEQFIPKSEMKIGTQIYFGDGEGAFEIESVKDNYLLCKSLNDFEIFAKKSLSLGFVVNEDLSINIMHEINKEYPKTIFALSFLSDQNEITKLIDVAGDIKLIAKIEMKNAIEKLHNIINLVEGTMIARGDLIYDVPYWMLNDYSEKISKMTKDNKKRLLMATGILTTLSNRYLPTRADLVDLINTFNMNCDDIILPYECENVERIVSIVKELTEIYHLRNIKLNKA